MIEHLGQLDFLNSRQNVILLGPPDPVSYCFLSICLGKQSKLFVGDLDPQAFSSALGDLERSSLTALDLMQHGLAVPDVLVSIRTTAFVGQTNCRSAGRPVGGLSSHSPRRLLFVASGIVGVRRVGYENDRRLRRASAR